MKISTALQAKNAGPGVHKVTGADGLYLKVGNAGAGAYYARYRLGERRPAMGLGSRDEVSLADAREAAKDAVSSPARASTRSLSASARKPPISPPSSRSISSRRPRLISKRIAPRGRAVMPARAGSIRSSSMLTRSLGI
jgi:hypothetical protein